MNTTLNFATATPEELAEAGFTVKTLRGQKGSKKSLWGVKSRVSGVNRKGQVAHKVGEMSTDIVMDGGVMRAR